jgi:hypothetical protein
VTIGPHNLILHGEGILKLAVVPLGPTVGARCCVDQLRGNTNAITAAP